MITVIIAEGYHCVGTCDTAFDEEGVCVVGELPWTTVADFALADDQADHITPVEFYGNVPPDPFVEAEIDNHICEFLQSDGVYMIYDVDANKHYFFV